jgi:hypothetical protein
MPVVSAGRGVPVATNPEGDVISGSANSVLGPKILIYTIVEFTTALGIRVK